MPFSDGPLLSSVGARLAIAAIAVLCLWGGVLWAYLAPPPPIVSDLRAPSVAPSMRLVVASGQAAPTGGSFDPGFKIQHSRFLDGGYCGYLNLES